MNKIKLTIILTLFSALCTAAYGQVTIGAGLEPAKGALLDLKEQDSPDGGSTSQKGLLLPRVELVSATSLEPLVSNATAADKLAHRGATVYNISNNLKIGLQFWAGEKWVEAIVPDGYWSLNGNVGTDPDVHFLGTYDDKDLVVRTNNTEKMRITADGKVGINTDSPTHALDVLGEVRIRNTPNISETISPLYINNDGLLGLPPEVVSVSKITVLTSISTQTVTLTSTNHPWQIVRFINPSYIINNCNVSVDGSGVITVPPGTYSVQYFVNTHVQGDASPWIGWYTRLRYRTNGTADPYQTLQTTETNLDYSNISGGFERFLNNDVYVLIADTTVDIVLEIGAHLVPPGVTSATIHGGVQERAVRITITKL